MSAIERICVYCGSGSGSDPAFAEAAKKFGKILADNKIELVFGGGHIGIMGAIADSVREHGGKATGIIPEFLVAREHALEQRQGLIITRDLHERKRKMFEMSDAFVALPGGVGTLEELVEQLTWVQLGRHRKPVLLANINKFWEPLRTLFAHMRQLEFIRHELDFNMLVAERVEDILPMLRKAVERVPADDEKLHAMRASQL
jgi:uncharacterized protein (TIGR00730 family)